MTLATNSTPSTFTAANVLSLVAAFSHEFPPSDLGELELEVGLLCANLSPETCAGVIAATVADCIELLPEEHRLPIRRVAEVVGQVTDRPINVDTVRGAQLAILCLLPPSESDDASPIAWAMASLLHAIVHDEPGRSGVNAISVVHEFPEAERVEFLSALRAQLAVTEAA